MKKNIRYFLVLLLSFMAADVQAQEWYDGSCCYFDEPTFYAKILGGVNFLENSTDNGNRATYQTGYIISGSLGYYLQYGLRVEAEYAFRRNDISEIQFFTEGSSNNGYFQSSSFMANLLWDLPLCSWRCAFWNIQPFVGAGIGYDFQQMHSSNDRIIFNQNWSYFSWQLMAGLAYPIFCNTEVTLEYKFHQGSSRFSSHSLGVGLAYKFGLSR